MNTNDFLKATENLAYVTENGRQFAMPRPHVICRDGFVVSIQANSYTYSAPREDHCGFYSEVELGYPNRYDELLDDYAEDPLHPTYTVYPYVPVEIVDKLLEKHGGIDHWK